jgi:hypothetical protein
MGYSTQMKACYGLLLLAAFVAMAGAAAKPSNSTLDLPSKTKPAESKPKIAFQCERMPQISGEGERIPNSIRERQCCGTSALCCSADAAATAVVLQQWPLLPVACKHA